MNFHRPYLLVDPEFYYSNMRRKLLSTLLVTCFLSCGLLPTGATEAAPSCRKAKWQSVVTSRGNKDVRKEIDRLNIEVICTFAELRAAYEKASSKEAIEELREVERLAKTDPTFNACLRKYSLSYVRWTQKYYSKSSGACVSEMNDLKGRVSIEIVSSKPRREHDVWVKAWRRLYVLIDRYPDSVKPQLLSDLLMGGESAMKCRIESGEWCFRWSLFG